MQSASRQPLEIATISTSGYSRRAPSPVVGMAVSVSGRGSDDNNNATWRSPRRFDPALLNSSNLTAGALPRGEFGILYTMPDYRLWGGPSLRVRSKVRLPPIAACTVAIRVDG